jgi:hypothetical protein
MLLVLPPEPEGGGHLSSIYSNSIPSILPLIHSSKYKNTTYSLSAMCSEPEMNVISQTWPQSQRRKDGCNHMEAQEKSSVLFVSTE